MAAPYQHDRLEFEDSIRLLDLLPSSKRDAPVQCRIRQVRLDQARSKYEALSYVWGDPQGSRPILCDDRELLVTPNCHDALIQLRRRFRVRTLWIDAICIDQSTAEESTRERNVQVRQMGEIFHQASTVVVWLGREELKTPTKYWLLLLATAAASAIYFRVAGSNKSILEYAFARSCVVISGTKKMKWSTLHFISNVVKDALSMFQEDPVRSALGMIQLRSLAHELVTDGRTHPEWPQVDFNEQALGFLKSIRNQESKVPHDKVYGVHSILKKMKIQLPDPDYSEPLESVVEDLTRACISSLQLDVVTSGLPTTEPSGRPSWIANFLVPEPRRDFTRYTGAEFPDRSGAVKIFRPFVGTAWYDASAGSTAYAAPENVPGRLQVRGKRMGLLTTVLACPSENESDTTEIGAFRDFLHKCREWFYSCSALLNGDILFKNSFLFENGDFHPWRDVILYPDCSEEARQIIKEELTPLSAQTDPVTVIIDYLHFANKLPAQKNACHFQHWINVSANWAFVRTDSGHFGRAYRTCGEGDELWLLAGSRVPVILREVTDGYRYIAPAYFYDMMKGQRWPGSEKELETLTLM
ncbi:hypothetical protein PG996_012414 [Apiospora saccharicola]|uniref:Heterokaryon incompatibility domain-containing protein n=1 Tax=Apiospora saccharicola TaxID=335842 RepID=A0ABR1U2I6_9PEZI